jgi:hypothetical protein
MRNGKLIKIVLETYKILYKKATPSADFGELMRKGITRKRDWFLEYYLDQKIQDEIIKSAIKKYKLDKSEQRKFKFEMYLGCSPRGVK